MKKFNVAIAGATGAVGEEILLVLEEQNFPVNKLVPLASKNSLGKTVSFNGKEISVLELTEDIFEKEEIDIAFFSAGGTVSEKFAPFAADAGAVVVDNTSHFRMDEDIPLVVPEVNPEDIKAWKNRGIIANPNCSTIQMVTALKPLDIEFGIKRVDVSTYQAVSGAGTKAMEELTNQMRDLMNFQFEETKTEVFPHKIALNAIPQIDKFMDNDYTKEEVKMIEETRKIMHRDIAVSATCIRIPVLRGHSESVTITFEKEVDASLAREILAGSENIIVVDNPAELEYPMPLDSANKDEVFVGRIRSDVYDKTILHIWVVADNLRVGAATNSVRIAQKWIEMESE